MHFTFILLILMPSILLAQDSVTAVTRADTAAVLAPVLDSAPAPDTLAQRERSDSIFQAAIEGWFGKPAETMLGKQLLKIGEYDSVQQIVPVKVSAKEGNFEFQFEGVLPIHSDSLAKLKKDKTWKLRLQYHDKLLTLVPKKKDKRVILLDGLSIKGANQEVNLLGEFWLPAKVVQSKGYLVWIDTLESLGRLRRTMRGFELDQRDKVLYPWLRLDSNDWISHYLAYASDGAYRCASRLDQSLCRLYGKSEAAQVCPVGWGIPSEIQQRSMMTAWRGSGPDSLNPFLFGPVVWEVSDADTLSANKNARMILTPWTGAGAIAPHFWSYFETFTLDSAGQVGLFQFGWSESGWMSEFNLDVNDQKLRPIRCVRKTGGGVKEPETNPVLIPQDTLQAEPQLPPSEVREETNTQSNPATETPSL